MQAWAPKTLSTRFWASVLVSAFAFFLSYPYQDSVALIFGSVVLVSVSLIRHYSAKPGAKPGIELNLASLQFSGGKI